MEQLGWKSDWERERFPLDQAKSKDNEKNICTLSQIWRQRSKDNTDNNTDTSIILETKKPKNKYQNTHKIQLTHIAIYWVHTWSENYRRVKIFQFKIWGAF